MDNQFGFLDILTILSFMFGAENWQLNTKQLKSKTKQEAMLATIIKQNQEIINLLKEKHND